MLYTLLRGLASFSLSVFYRKIEFHGRERIPDTGPVVFVSNHANALVDPIVIMAANRRRCSFLAKAPLFDVPVYGSLIRAIGALPAYRQQDMADTTKNQETFAACHRRLAEGGAIALFPEGRSHSEPRMSKIKTGAARIVLEAEAKNGFALGTKIIPIGLNWDRKDAFRSRVLVVVGTPIDPAGYFEGYRADPVATAQSLTTKIAEALGEVTLQAESWEDFRFVQAVQRLWLTPGITPEGPPPAPSEPRREAAGRVETQSAEPSFDSARPTPVRHPSGGEGGPRSGQTESANAASPHFAEFEFLRQFLAAFPAVRAAAPARVETIRREVLAYTDRLGTLGIDDADVTFTYRPLQVARYLLQNLGALALGFPLAAIGVIHSIIPYLLCRAVARHFSGDRDQPASAGLYAGLIFFPAFFLALASTAAWVFGWEWGVAYGLLLPLASYFALGVVERLERFADAVRVFLLFMSRSDLKPLLQRRREGLREEIEVVVRAYQRGEFAPPPSPGDLADSPSPPAPSVPS